MFAQMTLKCGSRSVVRRSVVISSLKSQIVFPTLPVLDIHGVCRHQIPNILLLQRDPTSSHVEYFTSRPQTPTLGSFTFPLNKYHVEKYLAALLVCYQWFPSSSRLFISCCGASTEQGCRELGSLADDESTYFIRSSCSSFSTLTMLSSVHP
jgi:hypothetical protein